MPERCRRPLVPSLALLAVIAALPATAGESPQIPIGPNSLGPCPGDPITPTLTVTGAFPQALIGDYVMLPFEVPAGTTQVRIKYCWEGGGNTVDLGIWQARDGAEPWGPDQFRGWGGSSHPDVSITPQGFSSEAEYLAEPKGHVPGRTTRGFLPGAIPAGAWAAELGIGFVTAAGDGQADFRVEIELSDDESFDDVPYQPAEYDDTPASLEPGWYIGDLHVHAEHSALGDATMTEVFANAFDEAGLDFIALTDYVTSSAWGEIGRHQGDHPGKLIIRSSETITYHGHANQHRSLRYLDHRIGGAVWELDPVSGGLALLREDRTPAELMAEIEAAGGLAQLNHVTHCPSSLPFCPELCRGCPWDYTPAQTDYARVQAIEVPSGNVANINLFTGSATLFWEELLAEGYRIAVVGVSDSHNGEEIGNAATVVYAEELSEDGILAGIRAGHTYAKTRADGADLRFSVTGDLGGSGIMGDAILDLSGTLRAEVLNVPDDGADPRLRLFRNGAVVEDVEVPEAGLVQEWRAETPGIYRIDLRDGPNVRALSSSIQLPEPAAGAGALAAAAALAALRRRHAASWKMTPSVCR